MIKIPGYLIGEEIHSGTSSLVYRAKSDSDGSPVLIKWLKSEYPTPLEVGRVQREYELLKAIHGQRGIPKAYALLDYRNSKAIVMEDPGGEPLDEIMRKNKLEPVSFIKEAIILCSLMEIIHRNRIIHKDIKPGNIILNLKTSEAAVIDFTFASRFLKENQLPVEPGNLEGTLQYMSPEQTGRMNRSIDYRSDYYSLGIMFYEMLTGMLPFDSEDPLEIIHSHLAKNPLLPHEMNPRIPPVLSSIVMKLIAKNAEERYQGSQGLSDDLSRCREELSATGRISDFEIAKTDVTARFQIPEKLYGRDKELDRLLSIFNEASSGGKNIVFITGDSGIGKSALIREMEKPIFERQGLFISGKYDRLKRNIPYSAIIQAFGELVKRLLSKDEDKQAYWKDRILESLGSNGRLITDMIPHLEILIGEQPGIQELPPHEAQNRFNTVFQRFVCGFTGTGHPLVVFLDDLQWIDSASLNILDLLFSDVELNCFLFFGSYRDDEVDPAHPLQLALDSLRNRGVTWEDIRVSNLSAEQVNALITDALHLKNGLAEDLARLTLQKTGGNPFFVIEFLKKLHEDSLIVFDKEWRWDIDKIKASGITENVVDLMVAKISKLQPDTLEAVKLTACIGISAPVKALSAIYGKSEQETLAALLPATDEGMIVKTEDEIWFVHDRVREAAYSLIEENRIKEIHRVIGMTLFEQAQNERLEEHIFDVVNHLQRCKEILDANESNRFMELSIACGKKSKDNNAWDAACVYFSGISGLMDHRSWEKDYENTLDFYTEWAEAEYTAAHFEKAEELFELVIENARNMLDKVRVYNIKILYLNSIERLSEAIDLGLYILYKLKFKIKNPGKNVTLSLLMQILACNRLIKSNLRLLKKAEIEDLIYLPEAEDITAIACIKVLANLLEPIFFEYPDFFPYACILTASYTLKIGLTVESSIGFIGFALVNLIAFRKYELSRKYSYLALKIIDKYCDNYNKSYSFCINAVFIDIWREPLSGGIEVLKNAFLIGLESGNFQWASYSLNHLFHRYFAISANLSFIIDEILKHMPAMRKMNQKDTTTQTMIFLQAVHNLTNIQDNENPSVLKGKYYDDESGEETHPASIAIRNYFMLALNVFISESDLSYKNAKRIKNDMRALDGMIQGYHSRFYLSLLLLRKGNKPKILRYVRNVIKELRYNSKACPENFEHLLFLLIAEYNRVINNNKTAIKYYEKAISSSKENSYLQHEALSNELAAKWLISDGLNITANHYLLEAMSLYQKWGAGKKVSQMETLYANTRLPLLSKSKDLGEYIPGLNKNAPGAIFNINRMLDLGTVLKASQAIASQIEMKSLLQKMIGILMENAGAQKGAIVLLQDGTLRIEANGSIDTEFVEVLESKPVDGSKDLSAAIVRYVVKTKEVVVLNNAAIDGPYIEDEYIKSNRVLSVLCAPVILQGKLIAVIYLENNLSIGAFITERVEMLLVLASQAAISIENARLIDSMKEKERLKHEMELAEHIQTSLCPPEAVNPEFEITASMITAEEVGGDYYDVAKDLDDNLWFAIGDVSGHGVTAGLIMMMAQTAFNSYLFHDKNPTPKELLCNINKILNMNIRERLHEGHFMTMNFVKYCGKGRFLHSGSHLDIIIFRSDKKKCEVIETKGVYLGIIPNIETGLTDARFTMKTGDILFLYTDGIIESRNNSSELWGMERLLNCIENNCEKNISILKEYILNEALHWCNNKPEDDMTIILAKKT